MTKENISSAWDFLSAGLLFLVCGIIVALPMFRFRGKRIILFKPKVDAQSAAESRELVRNWIWMAFILLLIVLFFEAFSVASKVSENWDFRLPVRPSTHLLLCRMRGRTLRATQ